jgi:hypothetical protein
MSQQPTTPQPAGPTERDVFACLAIHGILWADLVAVMALVVPRFERDFDSNLMQLSLLSEKVLAGCHWFQQNWHVVVTLSMPALVAEGIILALLRCPRSTRWLARCCWWTVTTLLVLANLLIAFVVLSPWVKFHHALSLWAWRLLF